MWGIANLLIRPFGIWLNSRALRNAFYSNQTMYLISYDICRRNTVFYVVRSLTFRLSSVQTVGVVIIIYYCNTEAEKIDEFATESQATQPVSDAITIF